MKLLCAVKKLPAMLIYAYSKSMVTPHACIWQDGQPQRIVTAEEANYSIQTESSQAAS